MYKITKTYHIREGSIRLGVGDWGVGGGGAVDGSSTPAVFRALPPTTTYLFIISYHIY